MFLSTLSDVVKKGSDSQSFVRVPAPPAENRALTGNRPVRRGTHRALRSDLPASD
jgi:hypothetical protein